MELTSELSTWISGLQASTAREREQWCRNQNPGWPDDEYAPWARAKAEVDPAVFRYPIDLDESGWQQYTDSIKCPASLLVGERTLGSVCQPEVADHLEQTGWQVTRVPGAGHDVRRQARPVAVAALVSLLGTLA